MHGEATAAGGHRTTAGPCALLAAALFVVAAPALPQGAECTGQLLHPEPASGDQFGCSVAAHGDTVAVGANLDDVDGRLDVGSVTVFAGGAVPPQVVVPPDARAGDQFGFAISIAGDTMAVGAPLGDSEAAGDSGALYVFERQAGRWIERQKLTPPGPAPRSHFGQALALAGDFLVVGAPSDGGAGSLAGAVHVFARAGQGAPFAQAAQATLRPAGVAPFDNFGYAVAIAGDTLAVGAPFDDDVADAAGAVYLFTRDGTAWREAGKLTVPGSRVNDQFGTALALAGNDLVVGARRADGAAVDSGLVYAYERRGADWVLAQPPLAPADPAAGQLFGVAVALDGDRLAVGALGDGQRGPEAGAVYLFERGRRPDSTPGAWLAPTKLLAPSTSAGDLFGQSVALSGTTVIPGAFLDDPDAIPDAGSAGLCTAEGSCERDLRLTLDQAPAAVVPGETLTLSWRVSNAGTQRATGVRLSVPAPAGLIAAPPPPGCSRTAPGFACALGALAAGESRTVVLSFAVPTCSTSPGPIVTAGTVSLSEADCRPPNNTAVASTPVTPGVADLEIVKTLTSPAPVPGGEVSYRLRVSNLGPHRACEAVLTDVVPPGLLFLGATRPCSASAGAVVCALPGLAVRPPGQPTQVDLRFRVGAASGPPCPGPLVNTATVASATGDPVAGNDTATLASPLDCDAVDLAGSFASGPGPGPLAPGDPVEYTIAVSNLRGQPVSGVLVSIVPDPALLHARWCRGLPECAPVERPGPDGTINDVSTLGAGSVETYRVRAQVSPVFVGVASSRVTVAAPPGLNDPEPANNSARVESQVTARLRVNARCSAPAVVAEGETFTFTYGLVSGSPNEHVDGPGDEFMGELAAGLTVGGVTATSGAVTRDGRRVTWSGALPAFGAVAISVTATVDAGTAGSSLCDTATLLGALSQPISGDPVNESALDPCCVQVAAAPAVAH